MIFSNFDEKRELCFIARYRELAAAGKPIGAQQLAPGERLPQLQHLQRRLQAAHAQERHRLDARRGIESYLMIGRYLPDIILKAFFVDGSGFNLRAIGIDSSNT